MCHIAPTAKRWACLCARARARAAYEWTVRWTEWWNRNGKSVVDSFSNSTPSFLLRCVKSSGSSRSSRRRRNHQQCIISCVCLCAVFGLDALHVSGFLFLPTFGLVRRSVSKSVRRRRRRRRRWRWRESGNPRNLSTRNFPSHCDFMHQAAAAGSSSSGTRRVKSSGPYPTRAEHSLNTLLLLLRTASLIH